MCLSRRTKKLLLPKRKLLRFISLVSVLYPMCRLIGTLSRPSLRVLIPTILHACLELSSLRTSLLLSRIVTLSSVYHAGALHLPAAPRARLSHRGKGERIHCFVRVSCSLKEALGPETEPTLLVGGRFLNIHMYSMFHYQIGMAYPY